MNFVQLGVEYHMTLFLLFVLNHVVEMLNLNSFIYIGLYGLISQSKKEADSLNKNFLSPSTNLEKK